MSAAPTFAFNDVDASQLPDSMDVASSPWIPPNDIDVDLDPFRDPSVLEDEMIDYQDDLDHQDDGPQDIAVDDVMDEASNAGHELDYNMDSFPEPPEQPRDEDEDVLYEDEDEPEVIPQQLDQENPDNQPSIDQEVNFTAEDAVGETIDQELDDNIEEQTDDTPATHGLDTENPKDPSPTNDNLAHIQDHPDFKLTQSAAQSPPTQPEWSFPAGEEAGETDLLPEDSEYVHLDSPDYQDENDDVRDVVGNNDSLAPHEDPATNVDSPHEEAEESSDTQPSPTREVHPVTLVYLEEEMSLFPPLMGDDSSVYFLSDSTLASQPLDKLLAACREILTGTLDHHDELVLDIPGLGLHICEDSKYSAQITLASVLKIYLKLCHNDPDDPCQPLYCHLSSRVSLASQYAYLSSAGDEGKTYTEIVADHVDTPEGASTHVDNQVHSPDEEEPSLESTEHELPPSLKTEAQIQTSQANSGLPHADEDLFGEDDGNSESQADGVQAHGKEPSDENAPPSVQDMEPVHAQEGDTGFGTVTYPDHGEDQHHSPYEKSPAAESNSSHTVEAYHDGLDGQEIYDEDAGGEDLFNETHQDSVDLFDPQENAEREAGYGDEELFAQDNDGPEVSEQPATLQPQGGDDQSLSATVDQKSLNGDVDHVGDASLDFLDDEAYSAISVLPKDGDLVESGPPITPSKAKLSKRKAEADDDLDFLEIGTPEPKRRRPS